MKTPAKRIKPANASHLIQGIIVCFSHEFECLCQLIKFSVRTQCSTECFASDIIKIYNYIINYIYNYIIFIKLNMFFFTTAKVVTSFYRTSAAHAVMTQLASDFDLELF